MSGLDDPGRYHELRRRIRGKSALEALYREVYAKYAACVARCPAGGGILEIGSGAGFAAEVVPELMTSDVLRYADLHLVLDARRLPFASGTLRAILMFNAFHHIDDVAALLGECERALMPGGRVLIVDQHPGVICGPILRYLHHEPFRPEAGWTFESTGPLSGANGALCWIVFQRDRATFAQRFPGLGLERYQPHTPLRYWLSGGLKPWTLLPRPLYGAASAVDRLLVAAWPDTGSFVDVELVRRGQSR
jgi:SAM-dependent methyltransferase